MSERGSILSVVIGAVIVAVVVAVAMTFVMQLVTGRSHPAVVAGTAAACAAAWSAVSWARMKRSQGGA